MAVGITCLDDANHSISCTKTILSRQSEFGEVLTVTMPSGAWLTTYPKAWIYYTTPQGNSYVIDDPTTGNGFTYTTGAFTYTIGSTDIMLDVDGTLSIQIVARNADTNATKEWRSRILQLTVEKSIITNIDSVGAIDLYGVIPAARIELTDTANRYASTNAEDAFAEIAGAGRTNETVKGNADNIAALSAATVKLTGGQTVAGVKTFTSTPVAPTASAGDSSTKLATTAFVNAEILADAIHPDGDNSNISVLRFNSSMNHPTATAGDIGWSADYGTFNMQMYNGSILQVGQEIYVYAKATENIANGETVQLAGVQGSHNLIKRAVASEIQANPYLFLGVATNNISTGAFGYVTWFGKINGVYTSGLSLFGSLWLHPTLTGKMTNAEPIAPLPKVRIGSVVQLASGSAENGVIAIRPFIMPRLKDLADVYNNGVANGQFLVYDSSDARWEAKTITASDLGAEPADPTILKEDDIGISVQEFDSTILKSANIGSTIQAYNAGLIPHLTNTSNPHNVTHTQIGAEPANANIQTHIASTLNPHGTTYLQVGAEQAGAVGLHNSSSAAHNLNNAATVGALPLPDAGGYYTTDTITGQLQQVGLQLAQIVTPEAWIEPTLINSWATISALPVKYYKDASGVVRFKGGINSGTVGTVAFSLPVEYRPASNMTFVGSCTTSTIGKIYIESNGNVTITSFTTNIFFDQTAFRVV